LYSSVDYYRDNSELSNVMHCYLHVLEYNNHELLLNLYKQFENRVFFVRYDRDISQV